MNENIFAVYERRYLKIKKITETYRWCSRFVLFLILFMFITAICSRTYKLITFMIPVTAITALVIPSLGVYLISIFEMITKEREYELDAVMENLRVINQSDSFYIVKKKSKLHFYILKNKKIQKVTIDKDNFDLLNMYILGEKEKILVKKTKDKCGMKLNKHGRICFEYANFENKKQFINNCNDIDSRNTLTHFQKMCRMSGL